MNTTENFKSPFGDKKIIRDENGQLVRMSISEPDGPERSHKFTPEQTQRNKEAIEKFSREELVKKQENITQYPDQKKSLVESLGGSMDELKRRTEPIREKIKSLFSEKSQNIDRNGWLAKNFGEKISNPNETPHENTAEEIPQESEPMKNNFEKQNQGNENPSEHDELMREPTEAERKVEHDELMKDYMRNVYNKTSPEDRAVLQSDAERKRKEDEAKAETHVVMHETTEEEKNAQNKWNEENRAKNMAGKNKNRYTPEDLVAPDDRTEKFMQLRNHFDILAADNKLEDYDFMKKYDVHEMLPAAFEKNTEDGMRALAEFDMEAGRIKRSPAGPIEKRKQLEALGEKFVDGLYHMANPDA